MERLSFSLGAAVVAELRWLADKRGLSLSALVRFIIIDWLNKHKNEYI